MERPARRRVHKTQRLTRIDHRIHTLTQGTNYSSLTSGINAFQSVPAEQCLRADACNPEAPAGPTRWRRVGFRRGSSKRMPSCLAHHTCERKASYLVTSISSRLRPHAQLLRQASTWPSPSRAGAHTGHGHEFLPPVLDPLFGANGVQSNQQCRSALHSHRALPSRDYGRP